ncbi:MAG TPA: hypothetical protein VGX28_04710 [Frankiaceae bacterium]|jgi:hypothetical protein|nr:hypothetical protein [Frankiaceae bacterium]
MRIGISAPRTALFATVLVATAGLAAPAHARSLAASIEVDPYDLSATAYVRDTVVGGAYSATLTAAGVVTTAGAVACSPGGAEAVVPDAVVPDAA